MLIIKYLMLNVKHLTLSKPNKWKKAGNFDQVCKKNRALLDFIQNFVLYRMQVVLGR